MKGLFFPADGVECVGFLVESVRVHWGKREDVVSRGILRNCFGLIRRVRNEGYDPRVKYVVRKRVK